MYHPVLTNIETKIFNGWQKNLPSLPKGIVRHQHPDSPVEVTEDFNGGNTNKIREIDRDKLSEHITTPPVPIENKVSLVLHRLKDFNAPGKLESGVHQSRRVL